MTVTGVLRHPQNNIKNHSNSSRWLKEHLKDLFVTFTASCRTWLWHSFRTWCQLRPYGYRELLMPPLWGLASFHLLCPVFTVYFTPCICSFFFSITILPSTHSSTHRYTPPVSIFILPLCSLLTPRVKQNRGTRPFRGVMGQKVGPRQILDSCYGQQALKLGESGQK